MQNPQFEEVENEEDEDDLNCPLWGCVGAFLGFILPTAFGASEKTAVFVAFAGFILFSVAAASINYWASVDESSTDLNRRRSALRRGMVSRRRARRRMSMYRHRRRNVR